jgi:DNA-binding MarR family transcriptional regulator
MARMTDHVDEVLAQWHAERPDLDVSPMGIVGRLSIASRMVESELKRVFALHGLDSASFDVLATLRRSGPPYRLTPGRLTHSAMVTSGAISQRLDRLEARGLLTRTPNASDGRGVDVTLSPAGHQLIDAVLPDHVRNEHRMLAALTPEERATLAAVLSKLITSMGDNAGADRGKASTPAR